MARRIEVELVGDSRKLEQAFARSEKSAKRFGRTAETTATRVDRSAKRFSGFAAGAFTGFAGSQALSLIVGQIKHVVSVSAEAQQVLGQTSVALEGTGKSWAQYGAQIQETVAAQSQLGFDDEALLQSFSLFVRTTGSVTKALQLNALAMDVARARFIDYDQAAAIVNKANLGMSGQLRRLGIDARKGASGVELLELLNRKYGGSAVAASDDAATAMDRFKVSTENAQESLGNLLLPTVSDLATGLSNAADDAVRLGHVLQGLGNIELPGGGRFGAIVGDALKTAVASVVPGGQALGKLRGIVQSLPDDTRKAADGFRSLSAEVGYASRELDGMRQQGGPRFTVEQKNRWWDAAIGRRQDRVQDIQSAKGQLAELGRIVAAIRAKRADTSDATRRLTLEDRLLDVLRQRRTLVEQIAEQERAAAIAAVEHRNQIFDMTLARQFDRVQDLSLRKQQTRWREIAEIIRRRIAGTTDVTRRLNLQDQLVSAAREERSVQQQITDQIKAGNQALKDRADAIKIRRHREAAAAANRHPEQTRPR